MRGASIIAAVLAAAFVSFAPAPQPLSGGQSYPVVRGSNAKSKRRAAAKQAAKSRKLQRRRS